MDENSLEYLMEVIVKICKIPVRDVHCAKTNLYNARRKTMPK